MTTIPITTSGPTREGLVSIVMPAFNAERYIEEAVLSVIPQSYPNWELLIVDDASTDATADIARRLAAQDHRITLLQNSHSKGVAGARNTAIERAQGEFIAFLDCDDRWLPDKLTEQVAFMRATNCALSATGYDMVDERNQLVNHIHVPSVIAYEELLRGNRIGCLTAMYSQRTLGKIYMPTEFGHEDYLTWLQITRHHGPARGLDKRLAVYRRHRSSLSGSKLRAAAWQWRIYRRALKIPLFHATYLFANYAVRGLQKHTQR